MSAKNHTIGKQNYKFRAICQDLKIRDVISILYVNGRPEYIAHKLDKATNEPFWECDFTLLQYTGRNDNTEWKDLTKDEQEKWISDGNKREAWRGREIYEGDFVEITQYIGGNFVEHCRKKYLVTYVSCGLKLEPLDNCTQCTTSLSLSGNETIRIIGNYSDNTELLNY